jgi:predicted  nucleic acid-binding Zn-ribbon protein
MRLPFVSRARLDDALAEIDGLRRRVLDTEERHDEVEDERRRIAEELAAVSIVNRCLTEDLTKAREQITDGSLAEWRAKAKAAERSADQWQKQYYDAVGLGPSRIEDSSRWQPGYKAPKSEGRAS